jgi:nitrogen regulatory protein PII
MKAIFIAYDQAHHEAVIEALAKSNCRGFTGFGTVQGRGSKNGEPHYGSHAWPSLANAMISMVDDEKVEAVMARLRAIDEAKPRLGLRAFVWTIEQSL